MKPLPVQRPAAAANDSALPASATHAGQPVTMVNTLKWLLDEVMAESVAAMRRLPAGPERLWAGLQADLDGQLRRPVIPVLMATLHGDGTATKLLEQWRQAFARLLLVELQAASATRPQSNAQLLAALLREAQSAEQTVRRPLAEYRDCLRRYIWALQA